MNEAHAQVVETVGAVQQGAEWYTGQAGIAAGTLLLVCIALGVVIWKLFNILDERNRQITLLEVNCAKEVAQAKIDAEAEATKREALAWSRVQEIYGSVQNLFGKVDASNDRVSNTVNRLANILATKGVFDNG